MDKQKEETRPEGREVTLKEFYAEGGEWAEVTAWHFIPMYGTWEQVVGCGWSSPWDIRTQSPDLTGELGRRTWAGHAGSTVVLQQNEFDQLPDRIGQMVDNSC